MADLQRKPQERTRGWCWRIQVQQHQGTLCRMCRQFRFQWHYKKIRRT